jgi:uncharacterized Fe-S center protein
MLLTNVIVNKIYLIKNARSIQYEEVLERELRKNFKSSMSVAVKLHMGEDKGMFSPGLAKRAIIILTKIGCKPFLFDTPVNYPGKRHTKDDYLKTASEHGFNQEKMGCPIIISEEYVNIKTEHMDVEVSKHLAQADALLVLTHFKGHGCSGIGGAIKNLAMGCVSPKSKGDQHEMGLPCVSEEDCTACGLCADVCPFKAIKVDDKAVINAEECGGCTTCVYNCPNSSISSNVSFDTLLAEAASACLKSIDKKPVFFVNDVRNITENCDCFGNPGKQIAKDVGIILGDDIVSIEMASTDAVINQEKKNVFNEVHHHDPYIHIKEAGKLGLGSEEYELETI